MDIITLGIGPNSDITSLTLTGLTVSLVFTGLRATEIKRTISGLDMDKRTGIATGSDSIKRSIAGDMDNG